MVVMKREREREEKSSALVNHRSLPGCGFHLHPQGSGPVPTPISGDNGRVQGCLQLSQVKNVTRRRVEMSNAITHLQCDNSSL